MVRSVIVAVILSALPLSANAGPRDRETILRAGHRAGISTSVLNRVVGRESTFNCSPHNHRYHGPLQISAASARRFGYRGGPLNNCNLGLKYGLMHLSMCVQRYGNNPGAVASCHARGG